MANAVVKRDIGQIADFPGICERGHYLQVLARIGLVAEKMRLGHESVTYSVGAIHCRGEMNHGRMSVT